MMAKTIFVVRSVIKKFTSGQVDYIKSTFRAFGQRTGYIKDDMKNKFEKHKLSMKIARLITIIPDIILLYYR